MTNHATASAIEPGTVLAGKFRIEQVLGQGGMGVVVAAQHLQLDERVALKFLLPDALDNAEAVARFAREARAAVKIKSEHVARVTDVGTLDSGSPYMVMEYLRGTDLSELVRDGGALAISDAVEYVLQACEAVAEAHALGIVHRDLKPANLFLTNRADGSPCIKVLDFGISKLTLGADSQLSMTRTASVMGSPLYMSPEQMASTRDVDTRTDIWAIGAILHELLTGKVPFCADTMPQLCAKILQEDPAPLRNTRPDAPQGLADAISRCLQKKPEARYPTVAGLAADLFPFGPSRGRVSVERITRVINAAGLSDSNLELPPSRAGETIVAAGITQQAWDKSQAYKKKSTKWLMLGLGASVVGGIGLAVALGVFSTSTVEGPNSSTAKEVPPELAASPALVPAPVAVEPPASPPVRNRDALTEPLQPSAATQVNSPAEPGPAASAPATRVSKRVSAPRPPKPAADNAPKAETKPELKPPT